MSEAQKKWEKIRKADLEKRHEKLLNILKRGPIDRNTLSKELGVARTTVLQRLRSLEEVGLVVVESGQPTGKAGRPNKYWRLMFWRPR